MRFEVSRDFDITSVETIGLTLFDGFGEDDFAPLGAEVSRMAALAASRERFKAGRGKKLVVPLFDGNVRMLVLAGLGKKDDVTCDDYRVAAYNTVRAAAVAGDASVALLFGGLDECGRCFAVGEGATLAGYRFEKYHEPDEEDRFGVPETVYVPGAGAEAIERGAVTARAQMFARDIANEPGNEVNPETFERIARALAEEKGLSCVVLQAPELKERGMNALLSVGQGSHTPPRLVHLTYTPKGEAKREIALVGKGITFDSGGLSLKPADSMTTMKGDKTGACAVLGVIKAVSELELPIKLHAIVGLAENMPGGGSYRPDDVIRALNGKTIEVVNTDAEGRVTLADTLSYASLLEPDAILDIATLTGACAVALGDNTAGLFSNDDDMADAFLAASRGAGERFWRLPIDDERLREKLKSPIADVVNSAGRYGGAITAAMFLEKFVGDRIPWLHLDIAATDFAKDAYSYYTKGATAFGTRSIAAYLIESVGSCRED